MVPFYNLLLKTSVGYKQQQHDDDDDDDDDDDKLHINDVDELQRIASASSAHHELSPSYFFSNPSKRMEKFYG